MKRVLVALLLLASACDSKKMTYMDCKKACDPYAVERWSMGSYSSDCMCNNTRLQDYPETIKR